MRDACAFSAFCLLPSAFYTYFCGNCIRSVKTGEAQKGSANYAPCAGLLVFHQREHRRGIPRRWTACRKCIAPCCLRRPKLGSAAEKANAAKFAVPPSMRQPNYQ